MLGSPELFKDVHGKQIPENWSFQATCEANRFNMFRGLCGPPIGQANGDNLTRILSLVIEDIEGLTSDSAGVGFGWGGFCFKASAAK